MDGQTGEWVSSSTSSQRSLFAALSDSSQTKDQIPFRHYLTLLTRAFRVVLAPLAWRRQPPLVKVSPLPPRFPAMSHPHRLSMACKCVAAVVDRNVPSRPRPRRVTERPFTRSLRHARTRKLVSLYDAARYNASVVEIGEIVSAALLCALRVYRA